MDQEPTVQSLAEQLREDGFRELADAVDYTDHAVAQIPESDAGDISDVLDPEEIPLRSDTRFPFIIGMIAGTLLERKYPENEQDSWPVDGK